jgi:hypothetical protein
LLGGPEKAGGGGSIPSLATAAFAPLKIPISELP